MRPARRAGPLVVLAAAAILATVLLAGRTPPPRRGDTPAEEVRNTLYDGLVDALRRGDVSQYLASFADPLRGQLTATADSQGRASLAAQLRAFHERLTGVVVTGVEVLRDDAEAKLEWCYTRDREVQQLKLQRVGGRWLIASLEPLGRAQMGVPYGTEVLPGLPAPATRTPGVEPPDRR